MRKYFLINIALFITSVAFGQNESLLKPGDLAPPIAVYQWMKGTPIKNFEKGKIYIVEFGATWCTPCKAMIPVLSTLQNKYQKDLFVMSVYVMERNENKDLSGTPTYLEKVKKYIEKQAAQINYAVAIDDPTGTMQGSWLTRAEKTGIPHTFIINKESKIEWIGSNPEMLRAKIDEVINGKVQNVPEVKAAKSAFDPNALIKHNLVASSTVSHYDPIQNNSNYIMYIQTNMRPNMDAEALKNAKTIKAFGQSLSRLYYLAYSDTLWNQILSRNPQTLEFPDTTHLPYLRKSYGKYYHKPILESENAELNELFNYDLEFGKSVSAKILQNKLREDLQAAFNYEVTLESRSVPCWILTVESLEKLQKKKSNMQEAKFELVDNGDGSYNFWNADMRDIIWMLGSNYGFTEHDHDKMKIDDQGAFLDHTNIKWKFNFIFSQTCSFEEFKNYLETIGLKLSKGYKEMKVVVIKDPIKS
jgi:thiol-disulfide isomerase/thioredoxin